jgi:hypothetical protein
VAIARALAEDAANSVASGKHSVPNTEYSVTTRPPAAWVIRAAQQDRLIFSPQGEKQRCGAALKNST